MPPQHLTIKPPLGGVVESTRLEDQPPGTCSSAYNCWPSDSEQRDRLSARPAIRAFAANNPSLPVRMLAEVNFASATETTRYLVASAGGTVYTLSDEKALWETVDGGWTAVDSIVQLSADNPIQAAAFGNKLFIADWEAVTATNSGTGGVLGEHKATGTAGVSSPSVATMASTDPLIPYSSGTTRLTDGAYFHLIFTTSAGTSATTSGISIYNTFVQAIADTGSSVVKDAGLTWKVLASTSSVDARDNAPVTTGVYRLDGKKVANGLDDLWDGSGNADTLGIDENKASVSGNVFTGTGVGGVKTSYPIGEGAARTTIGYSDQSSTIWIDDPATSINGDDSCKFYAVSEKIMVATGTLAGSLTDSSVTNWEVLVGIDTEWPSYRVVITGKEDGTTTSIKGTYEISSVDSVDKSILHLKIPGGNPLLTSGTGLRWHLVKLGELGGDPIDLNTFVAPANHGWSLSHARSHLLRITSPSDAEGFWEITSAETDRLTIQKFDEQDEPPGDTGDAGFEGAQWCVPRTAKVLDLEASPRTLSRWAPITGGGTSKGNVPHGSKMIVAWQDRMVLANDQVSPHVWHMSRNSSPYDFSYGAEDLGSPVAGTNFQGGLIGEPLTALISHNKACLLMGGEDSVWVFRGDPMQGGYIERLSDDVGVLGPWAHAKTDKDVTYFLSHLGLYAMPSGCGEVPHPVSEERLPKTGPKFWRDTDQLGFDGVNNGLVVSTSAVATATENNLWYDLGNGGWWPFNLDPGTGKLKEVTALLSWQPAAGRDILFDRSHLGSLVIGCENGKVCRFNEEYATDEEDSAIAAVARIGPINFTPSPSQSAMIQEIKGIGRYGENVDSTQVLYVGATAAQAAAGLYGYSMTWSAGHNSVIDNPRMSGHSLMLVVSGSGEDWAFEEAGLTILPLGRAR